SVTTPSNAASFFFSENDRRVPLSLWQLDKTFRNILLDFGTMGQYEPHATFWLKANLLPGRVGQQCISRAAVHQKLCNGFARRPANFPVDVGDSHQFNYSVVCSRFSTA